MSRKHAKPAAKSVAGYKMKSPRQCTSPTPWHGYNLQAGDIYGVDRVGPYVARPHMYKGQMIFMRPCRGCRSAQPLKHPNTLPKFSSASP